TAYKDRRPDDRSSDDRDSDDRASDDSDDRSSDDAYNDGSYTGPAYPYYGPGLSLSLGFGTSWRYGRVGIGAYCDGFYWSSWGCGPFYDPYYYPVVYRSYRYRPYAYRSFGYSYSRPYVRGEYI